MRRATSIRLEPLAAAVVGADDPLDEVGQAIHDATLALLEAGGLTGITVEDIATKGNVGRTTIYRRFNGRDDVVLAVLAREVRRAFATTSAAVAHIDRFEDRVIEGLLASLRAAARSPLLPLVRREPDLLRLVTVDSGPLVQVAVTFLVEEHHRLTGDEPTDDSRHTAELLVRMATSLVLVPETSLPLDDDDAARAALHRLFDPLLLR